MERQIGFLKTDYVDIKFKEVPSKACIDNGVFRLHYRMTFGILLVCSILASTPYFRGPISCILDDAVDKNAVNSFCFIHSKYTVVKPTVNSTSNPTAEFIRLTAHPGVEPLVSKTQIVKYQKYYQWVALVLFLQCVLFFLPHYLWKCLENGYMDILKNLGRYPGETTKKKDDDKDKKDEKKQPKSNDTSEPQLPQSSSDRMPVFKSKCKIGKDVWQDSIYKTPGVAFQEDDYDFAEEYFKQQQKPETEQSPAPEVAEEIVVQSQSMSYGPIVREEMDKRFRKPLSEKEIQLLASYINPHIHHQFVYGLTYFLCEVLNFFNTILQIFLMDWLLGFEFASYGVNILRLSEQDPDTRRDVFAKIFPKMTKCTFPTLGPTGNIINRDALCLLELNIINEKIYAFLWFWFAFLLIVTGLQLLWRISTLFFPCFRRFLIRRQYRGNESSPNVGTLLETLEFGDWLVLTRLRNSFDERNYTFILNGVADEMAKTPKINELKTVKTV